MYSQDVPLPFNLHSLRFVYHNARAPMNLILACDLAALRRMLGPLHDAIHASGASGAAVHVLPLESPPDVASATWLAIELHTNRYHC